jgi:hypothetical protein
MARPGGTPPVTGFDLRGQRLVVPAPFLLLAAAVAALASCERETEAPPVLPPAGVPLSARARDCPECLTLLESVPRESLDLDPHRIACARCHHPHSGYRRSLITTCGQADCHLRAWNETVMHRVDPDVFGKCTNCHKPHVWRANGADCMSCHRSLEGPGGLVAEPRVTGAPPFPHEKHRSLDCSTCHESKTKHASLAMDSFETCMSCHHGAAAAEKGCEACHPASRRSSVAFVQRTLAVAGSTQERRLPFDHEPHASIDCEMCHGEHPVGRPSVDCASCHDNHHRQESDCFACHSVPPASAHDLSVHDGGCAGCHPGASFLTEAWPARKVCLTCHGKQDSHYPGRECAACHKLGPEAWKRR